MFRFANAVIMFLSTLALCANSYGQVLLFDEQFDNFANWSPAPNNGAGCEWTEENGWAKIKTMGTNPYSHIFAVYESDLLQSISPSEDFSFKAHIRCQDGDPYGSTSNTYIELMTSNYERVALVMWDDSQAASGYGGLTYAHGDGYFYDNDPNGFGRINPTIDNELEIRREGITWTAYLDGVQLGAAVNHYNNRIATKVIIATNKYRYYGQRDGRIDYITVTGTNLPPDCSNASVAAQSASANCQATISGADVTGVTDPDGDLLAITVSPTTLVLGANTVTVTADDGNGGSCSTVITVNVADDTAPVPDVANIPDATGECSVTLTEPTAMDNCAGSITATTSDPMIYTTQGTFTVTWTYDDGNGNTSQQTQNVVVDDVTAPTLTASPVPINLWPPNHKYRNIDITQYVTGVSDNCNASLTASDVIISSVSSDEKEDAKGGGDGNTKSDIVITSCNTVDLRAERQGSGNGRVYTINLEVDDGNGNTGTTNLQIHIPKSQNGNPAMDNGANYTIAGTCGSGLAKSGGDFGRVETASHESVPQSFTLGQNYPNPFNPSTTITFDVPEASEVYLAIYNLRSQLIHMLHSGVIAAGQHSIVWNGTDSRGAKVASGVYLYQLKANGFVATRKLILTK